MLGCGFKHWKCCFFCLQPEWILKHCMESKSRRYKIKCNDVLDLYLHEEQLTTHRSTIYTEKQTSLMLCHLKRSVLRCPDHLEWIINDSIQLKKVVEVIFFLFLLRTNLKKYDLGFFTYLLHNDHWWVEQPKIVPEQENYYFRMI